MFRGGLVSLIYAKSLELPIGAYKDAAALTLMSADVDRIALYAESILQLWAYFIEIGIGMFLLERQVGWVRIAPILVVAGMLQTSVSIQICLRQDKSALMPPFSLVEEFCLLRKYGCRPFKVVSLSRLRY